MRIVRDDVGRAVARLAREGARYDIVFLDPPYEGSLIGLTLAAIAESAISGATGIVIAQHLTKRPPAGGPALEAFRARRFGETTLTFFRARAYDASLPAESTERS